MFLAILDSRSEVCSGGRSILGDSLGGVGMVAICWELMIF